MSVLQVIRQSSPHSLHRITLRPSPFILSSCLAWIRSLLCRLDSIISKLLRLFLAIVPLRPSPLPPIYLLRFLSVLIAPDTISRCTIHYYYDFERNILYRISRGTPYGSTTCTFSPTSLLSLSRVLYLNDLVLALEM